MVRSLSLSVPKYQCTDPSTHLAYARKRPPCDLKLAHLSSGPFLVVSVLEQFSIRSGSILVPPKAYRMCTRPSDRLFASSKFSAEVSALMSRATYSCSIFVLFDHQTVYLPAANLFLRHVLEWKRRISKCSLRKAGETRDKVESL